LFAGYRVAQQHTSETAHLSAQFLRRANRADIIRNADKLIQRRIQPIRVAGQPVADERQQLAQLHRIAKHQDPEKDRPQTPAPRQPSLPSFAASLRQLLAQLAITRGHFKPSPWGQFKLT